MEELEKELTVRILLHKIAIVKSTLANAYMLQEKKKGGVMLTDVFLERQAMDYADNTLANIMYAGKLDEAYEDAWDITGHLLPDDFSIMEL